MNRTALLTLVLATATSTPAAAGPERDIGRALGGYYNAVKDMRRARHVFDAKRSLAECDAITAQAKAAGLTTLFSQAFEQHPKNTDFADPRIPTFEAAAICAEFQARHLDAQAYNVLLATNNQRTLVNVTARPGLGEQIRKQAATCHAELDRLFAAGLSPTLTYDFDELQFTAADAKAKLCEVTAEIGRNWDRRVEAQTTAKRDAIAKPYKAVGISGDRLELLVDHIGYAMYGVGGSELRTPTQLEAAKLIFETLRANDGTWTVRRYQFKGNKLVRTTQRQYLLEPGARAYR